MSLLKVEFPAIGTTAVVVAHDAEDLISARRVVEDVLDELDKTCSRFRPDSELFALYRAQGQPVVVSDMLWRAMEVATWAAEVTGGAVDPTVGTIMCDLGYDRDFDDIDHDAGSDISQAAPGRRAITLDPEAGTVGVAPGVQIDLGATAKALGVDIAAARCAPLCRQGVLISVGGDLSVSGPIPTGGWSVRIADSHRSDPQDGPLVAVHSGALATSSTTVRRWGPAQAPRHHIVDPRSGRPAVEVWRTVTVAANSCVDANTASTAAVVMGDAALGWLEGLGLPARLVRPDGTELCTTRWPQTKAAA